MATNSFDSGQSLAVINIRIPNDAVWGPDTQILNRTAVHSGLFGIKLEAVKWTGPGNIVIKDAHGIELFSGATTGEPVRVHSALPHITVAAPLQITVTSGSSGSIFFYGQVL